MAGATGKACGFHRWRTGDYSREFACERDAFDRMVPCCDLCITVSGTATLHVASFGVPMIVVYRASWAVWNLAGRWLIAAHVCAGQPACRPDSRAGQAKPASGSGSRAVVRAMRTGRAASGGLPAAPGKAYRAGRAASSTRAGTGSSWHSMEVARLALEMTQLSDAALAPHRSHDGQATMLRMPAETTSIPTRQRSLLLEKPKLLATAVYPPGFGAFSFEVAADVKGRDPAAVSRQGEYHAWRFH